MEKLFRFYKSLEEIIEHLKSVKENVDQKEVEKVVQFILDSKRVFTYGAGRSGFVARCFAQRLMHIKIEAYFVGETITPSMTKDDVFIVVSGSGETASSIALVEKAKKIGAKVISVTAHREGTISKMADHTLFVPGKTKLVEKESYAPFTSLFDISVLSVFDSIASELMGRLNVYDVDSFWKTFTNYA